MPGIVTAAVPQQQAGSADSTLSADRVYLLHRAGPHDFKEVPMLNPNVPAWFEISTVDLDRAQRFYETILDVKLQRENMGDGTMAVFPYGGKPNTSGCLIHADDSEPSVQGCVIYLSVDDLIPVLERAVAHGGDTIVPRTALPGDMGFFAQFIDSEGNRVGLWSAK
jgi:predicted enzyme related to lactoylglutathione lyase